MQKVFQQSVKPAVIEEWVDYYIFRRLAAFLVPWMARMGHTPNQVSWLGLFFGFVTAWVFWKDHFFAGSVLLLWTVILDCCDGMLARFTGQMSPIGRIVDGTFDALWGTAVWFAIYFSGHFQRTGLDVFWLMSGAGLLMYLRCWTYDAVKTVYLSLCLPGFSEQDIDYHEASVRMKQSWKERKFFEAFIYAIMTGFQYIFGRKDSSPLPLREGVRGRGAKALLDLPMRLWTFVGEGSHWALLIFFGLMTPLWDNALSIAFWLILIPMNLNWLIAFLLWRHRKGQLI